MKKLVSLSLLLLTCSVHLTSSDTTQTNIEANNNQTINIGLDSTARHLVANMLNTLLADEYTLYTKTLNYHWNVTGLMFNDLHLFFGKQYNQLFEFIDAMAERIRALDHMVFGTLEEFKTRTRLQEEPGIVPDHKTMLVNLLNDHETIIREIRVGIALCAQNEDHGTENFLADLITKHEKMAWMLRSYVS